MEQNSFSLDRNRKRISAESDDASDYVRLHPSAISFNPTLYTIASVASPQSPSKESLRLSPARDRHTPPTLASPRGVARVGVPERAAPLTSSSNSDENDPLSSGEIVIDENFPSDTDDTGDVAQVSGRLARLKAEEPPSRLSSNQFSLLDQLYSSSAPV